MSLKGGEMPLLLFPMAARCVVQHFRRDGRTGIKEKRREGVKPEEKEKRERNAYVMDVAVIHLPGEYDALSVLPRLSSSYDPTCTVRHRCNHPRLLHSAVLYGAQGELSRIPPNRYTTISSRFGRR